MPSVLKHEVTLGVRSPLLVRQAHREGRQGGRCLPAPPGMSYSVMR